MLRYPCGESALLPAKSSRSCEYAILQGLLHAAPQLLRDLIKRLLRYLSPAPERIQQVEKVFPERADLSSKAFHVDSQV